MALLDLKELLENVANIRLLRSLSNDGDGNERVVVPSVPIKVWLYVPISIWVPIFLAMLSSGTSVRWSVTWASTIASFVYGLFLLQTLLASGLNSLLAMLWVCGFYALVFFMIAWTLHRTLFLILFWGAVCIILTIFLLVVYSIAVLLTRVRSGKEFDLRDAVAMFWRGKNPKEEIVTLQLLPESDFDVLPLEEASKVLGLAVLRAGETNTVVRGITQVRRDALSIYVQVTSDMEEVFAAHPNIAHTEANRSKAVLQTALQVLHLPAPVCHKPSSKSIDQGVIAEVTINSYGIAVALSYDSSFHVWRPPGGSPFLLALLSTSVDIISLMR